ncbi:HTH-type transcriptional regulator PgrR [Alphaproteobacteria bacterium SO-S41]|nr:HTH-type transcriptional regulator PgrR [Alphaproteobacteria bacterium SO-S41]
MRREDLADLTLFLAVADEGGFTSAAKKLGVSQSALSHALTRLETRLGLRLLTRTTRAVAPTEAGQRLIETLRPALDQIDSRLETLTDTNARPRGAIRITASDHAARAVLWPAIDRLASDFPELQIEINVEAGLVDIVAERFDAGVRLGERLEKDMIAMRIGPQLRMTAVASPAYLKQRGIPKTPHDLASHSCISLRFANSGGLYAWEFEKAGKEVKVRVEGPLIFNRAELLVEAALAGHGIAFMLEGHVEGALASGRLTRVLADWCEPFDGYYLYYPSRKHHSSAFAALLQALRYRD